MPPPFRRFCHLGAVSGGLVGENGAVVRQVDGAETVNISKMEKLIGPRFPGGV